MTLNVIIANDTQPNLSLSDIQGIQIWRHHFFGFGALDSVFRPGAELVLIFFLIFLQMAIPTRLGWLTTTPLPKTETKKREKDKETEKESAIFETETQTEKLLH